MEPEFKFRRIRRSKFGCVQLLYYRSYRHECQCITFSTLIHFTVPQTILLYIQAFSTGSPVNSCQSRFAGITKPLFILCPSSSSNKILYNDRRHRTLHFDEQNSCQVKKIVDTRVTITCFLEVCRFPGHIAYPRRHNQLSEFYSD